VRNLIESGLELMNISKNNDMPIWVWRDIDLRGDRIPTLLTVGMSD
jgi:hypothetical protein